VAVRAKRPATPCTAFLAVAVLFYRRMGGACVLIANLDSWGCHVPAMGETKGVRAGDKLHQTDMRNGDASARVFGIYRDRQRPAVSLTILSLTGSLRATVA